MVYISNSRDEEITIVRNNNTMNKVDVLYMDNTTGFEDSVELDEEVLLEVVKGLIFKKAFAIACENGCVDIDNNKCVSDRINYFDTEEQAQDFIDVNKIGFNCILYIDEFYIKKS